MLEEYFEAQFTLKRLRSGSFGQYIDGFAGKLKNRGYTWETARRILRSGAHFGQFVELRGISPEAIELKIVKKFQRHLPNCKCPKSNGGTMKDVERGARLFLDYLRTDCCLEIQEFETDDKCEVELIVSFRYWLMQHRGVSQSTQNKYCQGATELLNALGNDVSQYNAQNLRNFIFRSARKQGSGTTKTLMSALRMFLRFLSSQGKCSAGLERAIPAIAGWCQASLPVYLQASEVERIVDGCDISTPMGIRDRAIILLLARLGLRAGDVAGLLFPDIDWVDGSILVSGKSSRQVRLPLPQDVGDAILKYLELRPQVEEEAIFLCAVAPYRHFSSGSSLSPVVTRAMRRAGVISSRYGAHILRHTLATEMLRQGVSLYEIGSVLRHSSLDMSGLYAKVDVKLLSLVTQPWPEVLQ